MKIIHFISGLNSGGTERNLHYIVSYKKTNDVIFSIFKSNHYFDGNKVKIYFPKKNNFISILVHIFSILKILRKEKPVLTYCWMNHANVLAGLISYIAGYKNIIWNIRSSGDEIKIFQKNYILFKILILFSYFIPKKIIFNSEYSFFNHKRKKLNQKNSIIIFNGFKKKGYKKKKNKIPIIFLYVARNHPIKNHSLLLKSFVKFDKNFKQWNLILVGRDIDQLKEYFRNNVKYSHIFEKIIFKNATKNINKFYKISHFHVLSSYAESFPNVIGESMGYGIPNIAVNVGDVKKIILDKKFLVTPNDSNKFCKALINAKKLFFNTEKYTKYCKKNYIFINKNFSISKMIKDFKYIEKNIIKDQN